MKYTFTFLLIAVITPGIFALEFTFEARLLDHWVVVSSSIDVPPEINLLLNLEEGYKAEVRYQFQFYKQNRGFLAFLGDHLIFTRNISFIAYKHFFLNRYMIEGVNSESQDFTEPEAFLNYFIRLKEYPLFQAEMTDFSEYYLKCRVTLVPVKLESPLHIISLFSTISKTSEWVFRNIEY